MADFLASFDFGGGSSLFAPDDDACVSLDDFQQRLQHLIGSKTTATRAERVKATFDLAGSAQFTIAPTVDRNREADNVDPLLSGGEPTPAVREQVDQALVYKASDVLTSQAKDANQVRQTVAERIAAAAGRADTSTWLLYESKQDSYGCDFVFLCAHSTRVWCARNQKTPKSVVGDFTIKEPDSVNMGRPAFDCRGCILVSMSRKSRTISVVYEHISLHQTVADCAKFREPPPMIGPQKPDKKTLAMAMKKTQDDATKAKRKASREAKAAEGKRRKKDKTTSGQASSLANQASQALASVSAMDVQGTGDEDTSSQRTNTNGHEPTQIASQTAALSLNLTAEEAARRLEVARKLLSSAGVSHESLSADQLNIFANQSPELQKDSLKMLVKYGAERLQIIHPSNRESSSATANPAATSSSDAANYNGPATTTTQLVLDAETPLPGSDGVKKTRPLGKSRLACFQCKERKVRCPKERPTCAACQTSGVSCEYPPQKPRTRKPKPSTSVAVDEGAEVSAEIDADGDEDTEAAAEGAEAGEGEGAEEETAVNGSENTVAVADEGSAGRSTLEMSQLPSNLVPSRNGQYVYAPATAAEHADSLTIDEPTHDASERTQLPYYNSASGLSLPQPDPLDETRQPALQSDLALPQGNIYYPAYQPPAQVPDSAPVSTSVPEQQPQAAANAPKKSKGRGSRASQKNVTASPAWPDCPTTVEGSAAHVPPLLQHGLIGSQSPDPAVAAAHGVQMQDVHLLAHAASAHSQHYSPNTGARLQRAPSATASSPHQPAYNPRTKSQQGHRASPANLHRPNDGPFRTPPATMSTTSNHGNNRSNDGSYETNGSRNAAATNVMMSGRQSVSGRGAIGYGANASSPTAMPVKIGYQPYMYQENAQGGGVFPSYQFGGGTADGMTVDAGQYQQQQQQQQQQQSVSPTVQAGLQAGNQQQRLGDGQGQLPQAQGQGWQAPGSHHENNAFARGSQRQDFGWRGMPHGWNR